MAEMTKVEAPVHCASTSLGVASGRIAIVVGVRKERPSS